MWFEIWPREARRSPERRPDTRMAVLAAAQAQKAADLIMGHTKSPAVEEAT